ncbi:rhomboid family intramembrane serine protease [Mesobacterium sp. TK19101]|uniref:Rhomboid family intramembrane serine protease n=1 Tax=Mesobacterium hydrothermale TaxID=3111907 RepID=A0ABU6HJI4_9RHOB|nr:rhomboid family intramembrane serine protease [Mesobacterium sp. TK19101]MEC3862619.1 rhomboid family intramembrane serine protease [Mesobacterium sp. TK19101]
MRSPEAESPVNPLPPVIVALFVIVVGIEAAFSLGAAGIVGGPQAVGWRLAAVQKYAFSAEVFDWMIQTRQWPAEHLIRFVTYPFVHGSLTHAIFAGVMLLALGKIVAEVLGPVRTLVVFVLSAIGGALAYGVFVDTRAPLLGAFPPIYGLIGVFTYILWLRLGQMGAHQARAFSLIGMLLGIQLVFGLMSTLMGGMTPSFDWVADIGGFVTGFALGIVLIPGGWARIVSRLRNRG